ncbi:hypothetical protein ABFX02_05G044300 [Erythranthe guttata]
MISRHHLILLVIIFSITTFLPATTFSNLAADRSALLRLQAAVRGRTLLWNTTSAAASPCSWEGVTCGGGATNPRVVALRLPGDGLRGRLPPNSIGSLTELRVLSLRRNSLSGEIPSDLSSCTHLQDLHLQGNNFSGEIPASFFTLTNLLRLNLAGNSFSGNISPRFNNLTRLKTLYLENNRFTGPLPNLPNPNHLTNFNVSGNGLTGQIPSDFAIFTPQSFLQTSLCGHPLTSCSSNNDGGGSRRLSKGAIAGITIASTLVLLSIILITTFVISRRKRNIRTRKILPQIAERSSPTPCSPIKPKIEVNNHSVYYDEKRTSDDGLVLFGEDQVEKFSLHDLLSAYAEAMGKGTVGSTYKAYFDSGVEVIVKRLKNVRVSEEEFIVKIEEVGLFDHENLEPVRGYFYGRDEKLLLYEPKTNGSLSELLHGSNKRQLSWENRAKIALGVARGIEYLHSVGPTTTHGNLKASNVFLTENYEALVSEFCLTHLVSPLGNLNGYRAPEVADTRDVSQQADVYSFGILLLEILTGKEPDKVLTEEGIELPNWVRSVDREKWSVEVLDSSFDLVGFENFEERKLVKMLKLAMSCTDQLPDERPSIEEVARRIEKICG